MPVRHGLACSTAFALTAIAAPASAWQINYSVDMAFGYSDNINQSSINPQGSGLLIPRLNFDATEAGESLQVRAAGQVEYRDYLNGDFNNELRGEISALATWIIFPQRLLFDFEDYAGVEPVNVLQPNAPGNQQQTNVFTLGPTFKFRLWQTLNGQAELRFTNSTASVTKEFNSNRGLAALRAIKDLSPLDKLSLNVEYQDVHFTDPSGGPDYNRTDGFLRYEKKLTELDLDVAGGYSHVDFADNAGSESGPYGRAVVTWRATPSNTFSAGALRHYADASQDLIIDPAVLAASISGSGVVVGSTAVNSEVYLEKRFDAGWQYKSVRWGAHLDPYYKRLRYLLDPLLDQNTHGIYGGVSYKPRQLWTLAFDAYEEARNYTAIARRDEDVRLDLSFTDQLSRQWAYRVDAIRNQRNSDVADQGFRENVFFFTLIFTR
jgi:hypothetical protein